MNKQIKDRWTEALRSEDYNQGRGELRNGDRYCCLGVLCDLYLKEHPPIDKLAAIRWECYGEVLGEDGTLPRIVQEWANIGNSNPKVKYDGRRELLSVINDDHLSNFDKIADLIEKSM